jgi:sulfur carrier protein ThiS
MTITFMLPVSARSAGSHDTVDVELAPGSSVSDLLRHLEVRPHVTDMMVVSVDGQLVNDSHVLHGGERCKLHTLVCGG